MKTILLLALALLAPYAYHTVDELKAELKEAVEKQRKKRIINWSIKGWKIRWSVRDKDVDKVLAEIDNLDADDVVEYLEELTERLS